MAYSTILERMEECKKNACLDFVDKGLLTALTLLLLLLFPFSEHRASTSSISAHIVVVSGVIMQCFIIPQPGSVIRINYYCRSE